MNGEFQKDLVILVADANMEHAVRGLLSRPQALGVRDGITFDIFKHPRHDPGVFHEAHEFLRPLQDQYRYALVMLDREGSGQENQSAQAIEADIQQRLDSAGWRGRSAVVALDPELEVWVFSNSPHVIRVIADGDVELYRQILDAKPVSAYGKPVRPKEVMEEILRRKCIPRSSGLYQELAERVSLARCQDPAFQRFQAILQGWFPRGES
jgi:hypothetical protein